MEATMKSKSLILIILISLSFLYAKDDLLIRTLKGHSDGILSISFSANGKYLVL